MGAHAAARRRMPPMLHVAFAELMRGGAQQMLAGEGRLGMHQRHHILQLIAETEGAAGLIKPRAPPQPAAQGLIQAASRWPCTLTAGSGVSTLHRAEGSIPIVPNRLRAQRGWRPRERKRVDQVLHFGQRSRPTPRRKLVSRSCPAGKIESTCTAPQGSKPGAHFAGKPRALQRRRIGQTSVSADKFLSISGEGASWSLTSRNAMRSANSVL